MIVFKLRTSIFNKNGVHHGNWGDIRQNFIVVRICLLFLLGTRDLLCRSLQLILHSFLLFSLLWLLRTFINWADLHVLLGRCFLHGNITDPLWAACTLFAPVLGPARLIDAILLFLRHIWFLEQVDPLSSFEIEGCHIVQLMGDFMDASKYDHMILINACTVSTSACNKYIWIHGEINLIPLIFGKVKSPQVQKLIIVVRFAAEDPHFAIVHNSWVACSRFRLLTLNLYF